jgi:NAD(P)-dependent dehydrogenase (short-subunit alcohol dehydrogenase family)
MPPGPMVCWCIWVKLCRAATGTMRGELEDLESFPQDADGSAKVAIIGIERSMAAWAALLSHFPDQEQAILTLLAALKALLRRVESAFPNARAFLRPGLDTQEEQVTWQSPTLCCHLSICPVGRSCGIIPWACFEWSLLMAGRLDGNVAIVTGGSRGVALGREGAAVVLAARSREKLAEAAQLVREAGGRAEPVVVELTEEESIRNLVQVVRDKFGRLDILVNNAGITHSARFEDTRTEDLDRCWAINARAPFVLCREALPLLRQSPAGRIVNISSVVGIKGYPLQSAYTASKHALRGMSMSLAEELRGSTIRVHVICPGGVDTGMVGNVRPDIRRADLIAPEEIAELVLYLVTHRGNAVADELHIRRAAAAPWFG